MKALTLLFCLTLPTTAQDHSDGWEWSLGGSFENTFLAVEGPSPSLVKFDEGSYYLPRLELELEIRPSDYLFFHTTVRYDRGFDAGDVPDGEFRIDEAFLRYRPLGDQRLNFQIGKFATAFGGYVSRHDFYDDPFLVAPLPYGEILGVPVRNPRGASLNAIAARARGTAPGVFTSPKINWASTIWGPAYTTGASVFGSVGKIDYALEIKNVEPGAHASQWDLKSGDFDDPTFAGRIGYRPDASWNLGLSFSRGPYLNPEANDLLPDGLDRGDLPNTKIGFDARWAHGDFIFSGEVIYSSYETLQTDDLESLSWYLQSRWKAAPGIWLAARLGQTINNEVNGLEWSPDLFRAELAAGWRITPDLLLKAQYSHTTTHSDLDGPGRHLFGCGLGFRF